MLSATAPLTFDVDDDEAVTWRKCQAGFAPGGGDRGRAGTAATVGTTTFGGIAAGFAGRTLTAFAPLATGGVTVVFAMRSLKVDAACGVDVVVVFAVVVAFGAVTVTA